MKTHQNDRCIGMEIPSLGVISYLCSSCRGKKQSISLSTSKNYELLPKMPGFPLEVASHSASAIPIYTFSMMVRRTNAFQIRTSTVYYIGPALIELINYPPRVKLTKIR